ncbi:MAG: Ig-like domain-containing protein, partial [Planctomycetota bacterium]
GTDTISVTYTPPSGDTTPPSIAITAPRASGQYTATAEPLTVSGTASDNVGVARVTWFNAATGESGTATGTVSWSASIDLAAGDNSVTFTVYDAAGNSRSATITITYRPSGAGGALEDGRDEGEEGFVRDRCSIGSASAVPSSGLGVVLALTAVLALTSRRR